MAQHDYNLANQSGADFRADLNNALAAIVTVNSGATSPSTTFAHQLWVDTANSVLKIRNSANDAWITTGVSITADNTFTGNITGNASTATALETARTINGASFDGTANISFDTDSVSEGSSNLYFTNARVESYLDAGTSTPTFASAIINSSITGSAVLDDDTFGTASATTVATSESIKAYVDSQVGSVDTLAEILLNGNSTGGTDISLSSSDITGTGNINITGTVTSDGLTVDGEGRIEETGDAARLVIARTDNANATESASMDLLESNGGGSFGTASNYGFRLDIDGSANTFNIKSGVQTSVTKRFQIGRDTGDISFYDDTGSTQGFFWDASAESLGIGTTSPDKKLDVLGDIRSIDSSSNQHQLRPTQIISYATDAILNAQSTGDDVRLNTQGTTRLIATAEGNVGIGTASPATNRRLHVVGVAAKNARFERTASGGSHIEFSDSDTTVEPSLGSSGNNLTFHTSFQERARIDSSGNLLVGKTGTTFGNAGIEARENGNFRAIRDGANVADFNRLTSDGNIVAFYKDNTTVGSIGTRVGDLLIGTGNTGLQFYDAGREIIPRHTDGTNIDAAVQLGSAGSRFTDLYLSDAIRGDVKFENNTGTTEYARFDSSGNFGIGTSSPSAALHTSGNVAAGKFESSSSTYVDIDNGTVTGRLQTISSVFNIGTATAGTSLALKSGNGTEAIRIDSLGKVGIGTTSPQNNLHVNAGTGGGVTLEANANVDIDFRYRSGGVNKYNVAYDASQGSLIWYDNTAGATRMVLNSSGNVGIGTSSPGTPLHVESSLDYLANFKSTDTTAGILLTDSNATSRVTNTNGNLCLNADINNEVANTAIRFFLDTTSHNGSFAGMVLRSNGLGIGTASPAVAIHGESSTAEAKRSLRLAYDGTYYFDLRQKGAGGIVYNAVNASSGGHRWELDGSEKARIDYSGNFGIGTTSPTAKLEISTTDGVESLRINSSDTQVTEGELIGEILFTSNDATLNADRKVLAGIKTFAAENFAGANANEASLQFFTANSNDLRNSAAPSPRMTINEDGKVGIGTSSPSYLLHIDNVGGGDGIALQDTNDAGSTGLHFLNNSGTIVAEVSGLSDNTGMTFETAGSERMRIDSSGNVGINTSSPAKQLHVYQPSGQTGIVLSRTNNIAGVNLQFSVDSSKTRLLSYGDALSFWTAATGSGTNASEKARIDSSGNLLIGQTTGNVYNQSSVSGFKLDGASGNLQVARSGGTTAFFNRLTSDGTMLDFRRDGVTHAQIGILGSASGSDAYFASGSSSSSGTGLRFIAVTTSTYIGPCRGDGTLSDDLIDLGASGARFDDIYATNGTIQTSDRNEKQDIQELSDAEQRVATACKGLIRRYKFNSAVEQKGDDARYHFGIIAQDLQDAFTAEGLDAGDYGMFISDTYTDDNGIEQTRLGVRYNELLAFIIATL